MDVVRVLLVDDHVLARMTLARGLRVLGCKVAELATYREALTALGSRGFDLVLADYHLATPDETGLAFLERVGELRTGCHRALCTGHPVPAIDDAVRLGIVQTLLLKPVALSELHGLVERLRAA